MKKEKVLKDVVKGQREQFVTVELPRWVWYFVDDALNAAEAQARGKVVSRADHENRKTTAQALGQAEKAVFKALGLEME